MGRKGNALCLAAAVAGAVYVASRVFKKKYDHNLAQAMVCMGEGSYGAAIEHLSQILVKDDDVLLLLSDCHEKLHNTTDALVYLNMCVKNVRGRGTVLGIVRGAVCGMLSGGPAPTHGRRAVDLGELVKKRLGLSSQNFMYAEAFRDAFMLSLMDDAGNYKAMSTEYLKACSLERARGYHITGWASDINFGDFFQSLFFLQNIRDPAVVFLASAEYKKCYEYIKDGGTELHRFLRGCFFYVNGDVQEAANFFREEAYLYSRMMFLFLKATVRTNFISLPSASGAVGQDAGQADGGGSRMADSSDDANRSSSADGKSAAKNGAADKGAASGEPDGELRKRNSMRSKKDGRGVLHALGGAEARLNKYEQGMLAELADSRDLTVQLYTAKIFDGLRMPGLQLSCIDRCLANRKTAPAMGHKIIIFIKQDKRDEAAELIKEAVNTFPDDINLHCIAIEYFLHSGDVERAAGLLQSIECFYRSDPRMLIFKYLLSRAMGRPDVQYLRDGIQADSRYFKTYIHLGNHLMGDAESLQIYRQALQCARNFDELFTVFQVLTVVETEQDLAREYPELFNK